MARRKNTTRKPTTRKTTRKTTTRSVRKPKTTTRKRPITIKTSKRKTRALYTYPLPGVYYDSIEIDLRINLITSRIDELNRELNKLKDREDVANILFDAEGNGDLMEHLMCLDMLRDDRNAINNEITKLKDMLKRWQDLALERAMYP